jgi:two-component system response regulator HydG
MSISITKPKGLILLVDDDPQVLESTRKILELEGYEVKTASNGQEALERLRHVNSNLPTSGEAFDLILTDVRMPKLGGLEFLRAISLLGDRTPVILMTAFGRVEDAVWAMKFGAVDFLTKPFKRSAVLGAVEIALKRARVDKRPPDAASFSTQASEALEPHTLLGQSPAMEIVKTMINQVAPTQATVLLSGESGTGKELAAQLIHRKSGRLAKKFIALNCAAMPENLIESELFGYEKGAFTGALGAREGLFEAAHEGTLLLDEIGDMPLLLQAKLLRVLQEGEVRRVGATYSRKVDVRLIAATHRDLKACVRNGTFREDLLYRLEVVGIHLPSLRTRKEDLPVLVEHFFRLAATRHHKEVHEIDIDVLRTLAIHSWPGNIRELSNAVERAVVFARGPVLKVSDLPPHIAALGTKSETPWSGQGSISVPLGTPLKDVEELLIRKTLEVTDGDKNMTAKLLGINSRTIYRKLDRDQK